MDLFTHEGFVRDFEALRLISLDPQRHSAPDAHAHTLLVAERVGQLCEDNSVMAEDTARLIALAYLCLFMVADRVDCPGGFRANAALSWFLEEAEKRALLTRQLRLDQ